MTLLFLFMWYGKKPDPFYKSNAWARARRAALERDLWLCQDCMAARRRGEMVKPRAATVVHHIKPVEMYPELRLELSNLISLCESCHNKRHPEKGGRPGEKTPEAPTGVRIVKV